MGEVRKKTKNPPTDPKKFDELIVEMRNVAEHMEKYYSLKHSFLKGILYGLGFILGTTIVAGILLTMANRMFDDIPYQEAIENKIMH